MGRLSSLLIAFILLILFTWSLGFAVFSMNALNQAPQATDTKTGAIIALTGGNYRIATGMELLARGQAPELFISGIYEHVTMDHVMESWPSDLIPAPDCCIILGRKARTTTENAAEAKEWIEENNIQSIRLVTSKYHMMRALQEFRAALPAMQIIPHPVTKIDYTSHDKKFWELAFSEYHKYLYRKAQLFLNASR